MAEHVRTRIPHIGGPSAQVTRVLGVILHNWPLKLAAVGLATLLYGGLVLSQSSATLTGVVPVEVREQSPTTILLQTIRPVTEIRYFTPSNVRPIESDFEAWVDVSDVPPGGEPVSVPVHLRSIDPRVRVIGFEPQNVTVVLDELGDKIVPVQVDHGEAPATMTLGPIEVDPTEVHVKGPASVLDRVAAARASVLIESSGLDVDQDVELVAVDTVGDAVPQVLVDPATAHVNIKVFANRQSKTLPVSPQVTGSPAAGFQVASVTVDPLIVTVQGDADDLEPLATVDTQPIAIGGFTESQTVDAKLALPDGIVSPVDQVKVTISIRAVTSTRTFEVGPRLVGARPEYAYQVALDPLLLTVGGSQADLDRIVGSTLAADLDVAALGPGTSDVTVGATLLPPGVTLVAASPPQVPVTVTARATPSPAG